MVTLAFSHERMLDKIKLRKEEVLRYLGYDHQILDEALHRTLDECMEAVAGIGSKRAVYEIFPIETLQAGVAFIGTNVVLEGASIAKHLEGCTHCCLMAATLGSEIEKLIRQNQVTELTRGVILDACGTEAIEVFCDQVELEIKKIAQERNCHITSRFSPGYGDLSIEIQGVLLDLLQAYKKIGLTVTAHHIMLPRKSVTALIGLSPVPVKGVLKGCGSCLLKNQCSYRKGGKACELFKES